METRTTFLITLGAVQLLDAVSTVMALSKNSSHYENNPFISFLISKFQNIAWVVFGYEALSFLLIVGLVYLFEWAMRNFRVSLMMFYVFGFLYLVLYRLLFIVIPNFDLWRKG